jgi:hypothetical protein
MTLNYFFIPQPPKALSFMQFVTRARTRPAMTGAVAKASQGAFLGARIVSSSPDNFLQPRYKELAERDSFVSQDHPGPSQGFGV